MNILKRDITSKISILGRLWFRILIIPMLIASCFIASEITFGERIVSHEDDIKLLRICFIRNVCHQRLAWNKPQLLPVQTERTRNKLHSIDIVTVQSTHIVAFFLKKQTVKGRSIVYLIFHSEDVLGTEEGRVSRCACVCVGPGTSEGFVAVKIGQRSIN